MNSKSNIVPNKGTICQYIQILYSTAVVEDNVPRQLLLCKIYIMAKKMNRKLVWYKHHRLKDIPDVAGSYTEKDWYKELEDLKASVESPNYNEWKGI